jgi:2-haloacid dehalogenase
MVKIGFKNLSLSLLCFFTVASQAFSVPVKTLLFDVFGTCVEIKSSLIHQGNRWSQAHQIPVDWDLLVEDWIVNHQRTIERIRLKKSPWMTVDQIHEKALGKLLELYTLVKVQWSAATIVEISRFWHRLEPWNDVNEGLDRLHSKFVLGTLSNANEELLKELASWGQLPWDLIFSGAQVKHYKPDLEVYKFAEDNLGFLPQEIMLVASHEYDLQAALKRGWKTAFIMRVDESLLSRKQFFTKKSQYDYVAKSFTDLAEQLGL